MKKLFIRTSLLILFIFTGCFAKEQTSTSNYPSDFDFFGEKLLVADADVRSVDVYPYGQIEYHSFGYLIFQNDDTPTKIFVGDKILGATVIGARTSFMFQGSGCTFEGTEIFLEGKINFTGFIICNKLQPPGEGVLMFSAFSSNSGDIPIAYKEYSESYQIESDYPKLIFTLQYFDSDVIPGNSELYEAEHGSNLHRYNPNEFPGLFDENDKVAATITVSKLRLISTNRSSSANAGTLLNLVW